MCWPRVGEANPLFSVYIALWCSTALAIIYNVVGRQRNLGLIQRLLMSRSRYKAYVCLILKTNVTKVIHRCMSMDLRRNKYQTQSMQETPMWFGLWCLISLSIIFQHLLVEETGVSSENHRPVASNWQTLSHNVCYYTIPQCIFLISIFLLLFKIQFLIFEYKHLHFNSFLF